MEKFIVAIGAALGVAVVSVLGVFAVMLLATFLGGVAGWLVGMFFPYVTDSLRELSGLQLTDFQIGATLGFFGSAFRSSNSCDCD